METVVCTSLEEVVVDLLRVLSPEQQDEFSKIPLDRVVGKCHHGLGQYIRNRYLHSNLDLIRTLGALHADNASTVVMKELWRHLHDRAEDPSGDQGG
jgi:hypothetical protein